MGVEGRGEQHEPAPCCPQATSLDDLKAKLKGGWGDVEGFVRYFGLYPADITFENLKAAFK